MAFEGDLKHLNLADVFQNIASNELTGTLHLSAPAREAYVVFTQGKVAGFVEGKKAARPSFAELILQHGLITETELEAALKKTGRKSLSSYLEKEGILALSDQRAAVRVYVTDEVCELFGWKEAHFRFDDGTPEKGLITRSFNRVKTGLDVTSLLMDAARRTDEWEGIRRKIPSFKEVFVRVREPEEMTEAEAALLDRLDGWQDLEAVIRDLPLGNFHAAEAAAGLLDQGAIEPISTRELTQRARELIAQGYQEDASKLLARALELERGATNARALLAETLLGLGRKDEAVNEFKQLGFFLKERGDTAEALAAYNGAARLAPTDLGLRETLFELASANAGPQECVRQAHGLAKAALAQHLYDRAIDVLKRALTFEVETSTTRKLLAEAYLKVPDKKAAIAVYLAEAKERERLGDFAASERALRTVTDLDPNHKRASKRLKTIKSRSERLARAPRGSGSRRGPLGLLLVVCLLLALVIGHGYREHRAAEALEGAYVKVANALALGKRAEIAPALTALADADRAAPYTVAGRHAEALLRAIVEAELRDGAAHTPGTHEARRVAERLEPTVEALSAYPALRGRVLDAAKRLRGGR
ncbi:MAG: DUF4388 domain-containing protein [Planctomycetota bacterium]